MEYKNIRYEQNGRVVKIVKQNLEQGYTMSTALTLEMFSVLKKARNDDSVGVIVIDSDSVHQGAMAVSEAMMTGATPLQTREAIDLGHELCRYIENIEKPTVGVVRIEANGGGFETLQPCDFILCADTAKFIQPEAGIGAIAGWGGVQRLGRMVGWRKAQEILLLGEPVDGKTAEAVGIATKSVPAEQLDAELDALCQKLLRIPVQSYACTKRDLLHVHTMNLHEALECEKDILATLIPEGLFGSALVALSQGGMPEFASYHRYMGSFEEK